MLLLEIVYVYTYIYIYIYIYTHFLTSCSNISDLPKVDILWLAISISQNWLGRVTGTPNGVGTNDAFL